MLPSRLKLVSLFRQKIDTPILKLPWPYFHPNLISFFSIIFSILFVVTLKWLNPYISLACLILNFMLDWADGLVAKKYNLCSKKGWVIDVVADRISEGIIFFNFFNPWFYLFILNSVLTVISYFIKKQIILPLRLAFIIYFVIIKFFVI